jgi:hypothetical protein
MKKVRYISWLLAFGGWLLALTASAQAYNQIDEEGNVTRRNEGNGNFNKHNTDTTKKKKEVPQGIYVWTIDRRFGDVRPTLPDTVPHLFMNTIFNTGVYGEYNTTGNNYTPRESRIFIDRPEMDQFIFTQPYSWFMKQPQDFHFVNTLSPYTNITYDNCGDKQHGEDHIEAKFAVNANKRLGFGFDLNYAYANGYYSSQAASHFSGTLFASYLGDRYQMHALFSAYHQKVTENGGIIDDNFITHPENQASSFSEEEIPTVLSSNWNRNDNQHILFSHRYNVGFYRKVPLTPEELKARKFAQESKKARQAKENGDIEGMPLGRPDGAQPVAPTGRPDGATIAGDLPAGSTIPVQSDTSRIVVDSHEKRDSLLAIQARQDSIDATMKDEFVPVTSFIHTLDINNYRRSYLAYATPAKYYANQYYDMDNEMHHQGDSINDHTKFLSIKNTFAIALLEGFNKYAKAGVKIFASHELRRFQMPDTVPGQTYYTMGGWNENTVSVGGQIIKTQGRTLHYNLAAEAWLVGADAGKLTIDFSTDLNFPLFGDTVRLAASAFLHRLKPTLYQSHYHSKHIWWDNEDLSSETRLRVEGLFSYPKTKTQLRVAVEEVKNYTYFGMSYDATTDGRTKMSANLLQETGNINVLTAQLKQDFRLGILNWENVVTYQNSSNKEVLPLPALNLFSNLYLKFKVVKQLTFEIGGDISFFTKYEVPDYCPQLGQFAIQQNADSRVELGGYPYVDVYANMHLKKTRFFIMYSHVTAGSGDRNYFLTPHYPTNGGTLRFGVSWNFIN